MNVTINIYVNDQPVLGEPPEPHPEGVNTVLIEHGNADSTPRPIGFTADPPYYGQE
ncbi:hypothetical protein ACRQFN_09325 [Actinotignum sp. GS-2025e]|uniref:hypothetical protein n=1 Tax=unclassified Actinotignum TaxID=2632702 RepID=UPI003F48CC9D